MAEIPRFSSAAEDGGAAEKLAELAGLIDRFAKTDWSTPTVVPGLVLHRWTHPTEPNCVMYAPALTVVAQGAKQVLLAEETYDYDPSHYLVTAIDLPVLSRVVRATPEEPLMCLSLALDVGRLGALIAMPGFPEPKPMPVPRGMAANRIGVPLLDAVLRLVRLMEAPASVPILAPLIEQEILYHLLTGVDGARLRHLAVAGSHAHRVACVTEWLKANYAEPLRIGDLAKLAHMSVSSLHHHFKAITAMSPLQYQKRLRLHEARRLMLVEKCDAASAGHAVGYDSASQFSREYSRVYGTPPRRDVTLLQVLPPPV